MMCGITGTPGTGKSSAAGVLERRGYRVVRLSETFEGFIIGRDDARQTLVVDEERWAQLFPPVDGFVEGHLAHLLPCDLVVVLRCRPDVLSGRLAARWYNTEKIRENVEAEALDVILIETLERHGADRVLEIDATQRSPDVCADTIIAFSEGKTPPAHGSIDWSCYLVAADDT
ncbi:MAG: adenylate kinase family protein [Methanoregulaceae archaeon]|nr:adenylate kinase family protein [Methanoregulaceae archaeon]